MHNWLNKIAISNNQRVQQNIARLEELKKQVHSLGYFVVSYNGGGYSVLQELLESKLVKGRPNIQKKLEEAFIGENDQKIALDAPIRFQRIMGEAEVIIGREIFKEQKKLSEPSQEN